LAKAKWDDACAAAYLLHVAADLVRDDTPFHQEVEALAKAGYRALRTKTVKKVQYTDNTVMPEESFRRRLAVILLWEKDDIDRACRTVRADSRAKNRQLRRDKPT